MRWLTWRRELDWRLQNLLTYSPPVLKRTVSDVRRIERGLSANQHERYRSLVSIYDITPWTRVCNRDEFMVNLYVLDVCDRFLPAPAAHARGLDIGAGGWSYLPALTSWSRAPWDGIELDAHRRYWTLCTRRGHGEYMRRICAQCRYRVGSLLSVQEHFGHITWFLPYVNRAALQAGRLPDRFFQPQALLHHALERLHPGGTMLILNQGEDEAHLQAEYLANTTHHAEALGRIDSVFSRFTQPRYAWRVLKP